MPKNRTSACSRMLEHVLPPNVPADTMQGIIVGSLAIGALTAAIDFTVHYAATYRGMFYWDGRLMDTALMGPFSAMWSRWSSCSAWWCCWRCCPP